MRTFKEKQHQPVYVLSSIGINLVYNGVNMSSFTNKKNMFS